MSDAETAEDQPPGLPASPIIVSEIPKFDLESYISNYDGATRLDRLVCIGTSSKVLAVDALKLALAEAKKGKNVRRYHDIATHLQKNHPNAGIRIDEKWMEETSKQMKRETERLESELKGYKNNLIKESIRMGQEEMGAHYLAIGDLTAALRCYYRMREYCTTARHISEMNLKVIITSIRQGQWLTVSTNIQRIQGMQHSQEDSNILNAISSPLIGLASLCSGDYRSATTSFTASKPDFMNMGGDTSGSTYLSGPSTSGPSTINSTSSIGGINFAREALSPNDVAVYGALCALATYDRETLQSRVLESQNFRSFLELEPHLRRAIAAFVGAKYTEVLSILEGYRPDYLLDFYLQRHVGPLWELIRKKCMIAYFEPFSRVDIKSMVAAFGSNHDNAATGVPRGTQGSGETSPEINGNVAVSEPASASTSTTVNNKKVTLAALNAMTVELTSMIESRELNARIDLVDGLLIATNPNDSTKTSTTQQNSDGKSNDRNKTNNTTQASSTAPPSRTALLKRALNVAQEQEKTMRLKLFRSSLVEGGWIVRDPKGPGGGPPPNLNPAGSGVGGRGFGGAGYQGKQGFVGRGVEFGKIMKGKIGGLGGAFEGVGGRAFDKGASGVGAARVGAPFQAHGETAMQEQGGVKIRDDTKDRGQGGTMDTSELI